MLMLYLFKIEVFDLNFHYTYAIDRVVIADTHEDRRWLIGQQFGAHNGSIVRRSVLLGARRLTVDEVRLLQTSVGTTEHVWLVTSIRPSRQKLVGRSLPRLSDEESLQELVKRTPGLYDTVKLREDQYVGSVWFS